MRCFITAIALSRDDSLFAVNQQVERGNTIRSHQVLIGPRARELREAVHRGFLIGEVIRTPD